MELLLFKSKIKKHIAGMAMCLAFCGIFISAKAAPVDNFKSANEAFEAGRFSEAIRLYENILAENIHSKEVYFNLGNAYLENEKIGKAILNYEKALKLSPKNTEVENNLTIAKSRTRDEIEALPLFFVSRFFSKIQNLFSLTGWAIFTLIFLWAGLGILILQYAGKAVFKNTSLTRTAVIGSLALAVLGLLTAFAKNHSEQNYKQAIILTQKTALKEAASEGSPDVLFLYEGNKVEILDKIETWFKIRSRGGDEGWISEKDMEVI